MAGLELHGTHHAEGFLVATCANAPEYLGILHVALLVDNELDGYPSFDAGSLGDRRVLDLLRDGFEATDEFWRILDDDKDVLLGGWNWRVGGFILQIGDFILRADDIGAGDDKSGNAE
jgi:hypothetical protein